MQTLLATYQSCENESIRLGHWIVEKNVRCRSSGDFPGGFPVTRDHMRLDRSGVPQLNVVHDLARGECETGKCH